MFWFVFLKLNITDNEQDHTQTQACTQTEIRPIDQLLTTLWGDKFIEEAGQSGFMAGVAGSRQDNERVHVHLMVHERTMASAFLLGTSEVGQLCHKGSTANQQSDYWMIIGSKEIDLKPLQ